MLATLPTARILCYTALAKTKDGCGITLFHAVKWAFDNL
jgi:hypothetical protein